MIKKLLKVVVFLVFSYTFLPLYAQVVYVDDNDNITDSCVEPGGIILTEKPSSDFKIEFDQKTLYILPVPVTSTSFGDYQICEKEFPIERINVRMRKKSKGIKPSDDDIAEKIKSQKNFLKSIYLKEPVLKMWEGNFIFPLKNYKSVKDNFGARRIVNGVSGPIHRGIDISANRGEKVYASNSGIVAVARKFVLEGNLIVINHGTGIYTIYAHLKDILVKEGELVRKGQLIGHVGSTGRSVGYHLHFGAKVGQVDVNPYALFGIQDVLSVAFGNFDKSKNLEN